jgi:hypothetical protein
MTQSPIFCSNGENNSQQVHDYENDQALTRLSCPIIEETVVLCSLDAVVLVPFWRMQWDPSRGILPTNVGVNSVASFPRRSTNGGIDAAHLV